MAKEENFFLLLIFQFSSIINERVECKKKAQMTLIER